MRQVHQPAQGAAERSQAAAAVAGGAYQFGVKRMVRPTEPASPPAPVPGNQSALTAGPSPGPVEQVPVPAARAASRSTAIGVRRPSSVSRGVGEGPHHTNFQANTLRLPRSSDLQQELRARRGVSVCVSKVWVSSARLGS